MNAQQTHYLELLEQDTAIPKDTKYLLKRWIQEATSTTMQEEIAPMMQALEEAKGHATEHVLGQVHEVLERAKKTVALQMESQEQQHNADTMTSLMNQL